MAKANSKTSKEVAAVKPPRSMNKTGGDADRKARVLIGDNNVYEIPIVFVYGSLDLYKEVREKLFTDNGDKLSDAKGYCTFGRYEKGKDGTCVATVWANWRYPLKQALPIFIHELTHAADDILKQACVEDGNGEALAYLIERSVEFLTKNLYGIKPPKSPTELVREALHDITTSGMSNGKVISARHSTNSINPQ